MLKILLNIDCSINSFQAQDRDGKAWCQFLNPTKYLISVFCSDTPDPRIAKQENINIIYLSQNRKVNAFKKFYNFHFMGNDLIINGKNDIGLIQSLWWHNRNKFNKLKIFFGIKKPIVIQYLGGFHQIGINRSQIDYLLKNSDKVLAISDQVSKNLKKELNIEAPIIHPSHDINMFTPLQHNNYNRQKSIICVGSMVFLKNPFLFANIAKQLPDHYFTWIGERYLYDFMLEKKERDNINNLYIPGSISNRDMPSELRKHDIFLFTSMMDGFGNVIVEAMACGLPCIVFDIGGPQEIVLNNKTGFVVSDEYEMLEKLEILTNDNDLLRIFSVASRKRALDYDGRKNIHIFEGFIDKTLAG
tara:strand:+ start:1033 stop:2109 length:1077 start_codon:yes stop_codon:yes gene_type:complete